MLLGLLAATADAATRAFSGTATYACTVSLAGLAGPVVRCVGNISVL